MAKIKGIKCIRTRAEGMWTIVKIFTDQPGLYGIGSASDITNQEGVIKTVENLLAPQLIGRDASQIENIWQTLYPSGYWRNGAATNTALGAIDVALWDIKGKEAGMPVYQLLGGPCRTAVPCYAHAGGNDFLELEDSIRAYLEEGYPVVRCQLGPYGGGGFIPSDQARRPKNAWPDSHVFDDERYVDTLPKMFAHLRDKLGFGPKLTHDVHEHLRPQSAVVLSKLLEPYRLFFLEDALPPEQVQWYRLIREQCTTPQAMGELFVHPFEWMPLVTERLIDYLRLRVSKAGGISPCRKAATLCEAYGVQTAWQEGGDNDPVNQMAAVHLDMVNWSFGIQEENHFKPEEYEAFPGHAVLEGGYLYPNDSPGLGIDIDEEKAERLIDRSRPFRAFPAAEERRADGTVVRP
ncbi:MAG: mandelate racemase [candidate division Zixibacteria bacterium]|nr:mandelate racemase [candidate division Zixibacteria bacterium]